MAEWRIYCLHLIVNSIHSFNLDTTLQCSGKYDRERQTLPVTLSLEMSSEEKNTLVLRHTHASQLKCNSIFVSQNLIVSELKSLSLECEGTEDVWLNVSLLDSSDLVVGTIYRHSNTDLLSFEQACTETLKHLRSNQSYVVMGDFNVDYNKYNSVPKIQHYVNSITSLGSEQLITISTRITSTLLLIM